MLKFRCSECGKEYDITTRKFRCDCGGVFELVGKHAEFPLEKIKSRKPAIWRYREAIPIDDEKNIVSIGEGFTPLIPIEYENFNLIAKLDFIFPTGSFKDRGSSVLVSKLKELEIRKIVEDSSGNAGASISAYTAKAGIDCEIFCRHVHLKANLRR